MSAHAVDAMRYMLHGQREQHANWERMVTRDLVRLTLYSRGGVPMVGTLPALIVLVFIGAAILAGLLTTLLHLHAWR